MIVALLTAGGVGSRMGMEVPKQFWHVQDRPLLIHTLERFQEHPSVDEIVVATLPNWMEVLRAYAKQYKITKLKHIVAGGATGQESIHNGLIEIKDKYGVDGVNVMVHDGNRAMISQDIISDSISVFEKKGSAVAVIPCVEAVFRSHDDGETSKDSIPREQLYRTQTPHTYTLEKLLWAHEQAEEKGIENTAASCTLMYELGETVCFSKGSEKNLKITTQDDLDMMHALLKVEQN